ncbi:flagellin [Caproiciproducens galactitolivorans]|uniref:Flagellin n=1 Tax=Caproiciproducens galactitolivorans TaxID=642589 RepID=A0A4Z0YJQ4_9FIRM|nr:flagellin [Caproiciproducens galactitolivorans]QEY34357.1 flagellin [Caproiciproducens galactitolivorans]TGJ77876.1 flagellin B [Caproiciproducens galactitolivorans]
MRIQHNISALNANRMLGINNDKVSKNLEKLSSGYKINRAGDDAAGLAISEKMRGQIRGLDQATNNANDGISLVQTAEGALNETASILQRMKELATQSSNGTYQNAVDRENISKEVESLKSEITRIATSTNFNKINLLDGSLDLGSTATATIGTTKVTLNGVAKLSTTTPVTGASAAATVTFADGKDNASGSITAAFNDATGGLTITLGTKDTEASFTAEQITAAVRAAAAAYANGGTTNALEISKAYSSFEVKFEGTITGTAGSSLTAAAATMAASTGNNGLTLQIGASYSADQQVNLKIGNMSTAGLGLTSVKVDTQENALAAISTIDAAINIVSGTRADLGALQNRLEHTVSNLGVTSENLTSAESRIRDVDMAKEMMDMTKNNVLAQAAQSMLAQANQQPQNVLKLLQ